MSRGRGPKDGRPGGHAKAAKLPEESWEGGLLGEGNQGGLGNLSLGGKNVKRLWEMVHKELERCA